jgi:hypothetical protein
MKGAITMTKREIMDLVRQNNETKTFYAQHEGYGFHGTSQDYVVEQLNALICQMPGCGSARGQSDGRSAYLCPSHFAEACREGDAR